MLIYANNQTTFWPTATIWDNSNYTSWFNNYGVQFVDTPDTPSCTLVNYISNTDTIMTVDNAKGLPVSGTLQIADEVIGYQSIDRDKNIIQGLSRGLYNTIPTAHEIDAVVLANLPAVILLYGGRKYTSVPTVTVYIDLDKYPAPRVTAEFRAVLGDEDVIAIETINPGSGYIVTPEIIIESSYSVEFTSMDVSFTQNTITIVEIGRAHV